MKKLFPVSRALPVPVHLALKGSLGSMSGNTTSTRKSPSRRRPAHSESFLTGLRAGATVLHVVALIITIYRLNHRRRIKRLSWDDFFAFLGLFLDAQELVCLWWVVYVDDQVRLFPGSGWEKLRSILYWTISVHFTLIICFTRVSLWASIRRILAPGRLRTACIPLAVVTLSSGLSLLILKACTCSYTSSPLVRYFPITCRKKSASALGIFQSALDVALSAVIIAVPLCAVWRMGLSREKRNLLMIVFTASCATLAVALVHNFYVLQPNILLLLFTSHCETAVSLIVCNIHIVVPTLYAKFKSSDDDDGSEDSTATDNRTTLAGASIATSQTRTTEGTVHFTSVSNDMSMSDDSQPTTSGGSGNSHPSAAPLPETTSAQTNPHSLISSHPTDDPTSSVNTDLQEVSRKPDR